MTVYINLPTAFIVTAPFGTVSWRSARILWMIFTGTSFLLAAYLMWDLAADYAPRMTGLLMCAFLFNSGLLLKIGNPAGVAIGLSVIAVWCFVKERFVPAAILCFAVSLVLKPHVAGLVWLYFLLAGKHYRKRAWQTMAVTVVLCVPGILWVSHVAPHWRTELQTNLQTLSEHGALNDSGPTTVDPRFPGALIIDLQSALSLLHDDPKFYNPVTYFICAPLLLIWAIATLRKRATYVNTWLALATIVPLSMLPLYHRTHDTRLLLLALPAFAFLRFGGGLIAHLALLITGGGFALIGIIPAQLLAIYSTHLRESTHGIPGMLLSLLLTRPTPLILLAMSIFYLCVYVRHTATAPALEGLEEPQGEPQAHMRLESSVRESS